MLPSKSAFSCTALQYTSTVCLKEAVTFISISVGIDNPIL